ncbi:MAG: ThiF family adenylyltransferase [Actinomycetota bacterium]|nr:ThiF family adenylyltransferase [Actinomycetota bacterium]
MSLCARMAQVDYERLHDHLFPGDHDEHAAFLYAGCMDAPGGETRLLIRDVVPVPDHYFGRSHRGGYRQVAAPAVARAAMHCEDQGLHLIWAHSHPGAHDHVAFSEPDLATHRRAHPGLIALTGERTVTSLVFGEAAVAGEAWTPDGAVHHLSHLDVVGARAERLTAAPQAVGRAAARFSRQTLMFGAAGQQAMRQMTVAVLGAGGGGSLLIQGLAHLGVGRILIVDVDVVSLSNLSRIVGATLADARWHRQKVQVMRRMVCRIDPGIKVEAIAGDVSYAADARRVADADYIFGATDTMMARFALNAISHQYLIPAMQVGAKIVSDPTSGKIELAFAVQRPIDFAGGCLECAGAIDPAALHAEQLSDEARRAQRYLDDELVPIIDPSVITLNSLATSMALTDFQLAATRLAPVGARLNHRVHHAIERVVRERDADVRPGCRWCDRQADYSVLASGDELPLPLRPGSSPRTISRFERALGVITRRKSAAR